MSELSAVRKHCPDHDYWCSDLTRYINLGEDASELDFGIIFDVPLQPSKDLWATVKISTESIADTCAPMYLIVQGLFTDDITEHPLGLWTKGEGMFSIRAVILDWVKSQARIKNISDTAADCPSSSHSFKHIKAVGSLTTDEIILHNWFIATYGLCYPQYQEIAGFNNSALVPDAGDRSSNHANTMNKLRNRKP